MPKRPERRKRRISIDILVNKYIDGEPHVCRAVNVSSGGMLLYKVFEPDVAHEEVSLEFQLPGSARVLRADGIPLADGAAREPCGVVRWWVRATGPSRRGARGRWRRRADRRPGRRR